MDTPIPQNLDNVDIPVPPTVEKSDNDFLKDLQDVSSKPQHEPLQKSISPEPVVHEVPKVPQSNTGVGDVKPPYSTDLNDFLSLDVKPNAPVASSIETKDVLGELKKDTQLSSSDLPKDSDIFGFNKPLPPEPVDSIADFLKAEGTRFDISKFEDKADDPRDFVLASGSGDASPIVSRESSPMPPPIPKHQHLRDESPDRFESSPEPDFKLTETGRDEESINEPSPLAAPKPASPAVKPPPKSEEKKEKSFKEMKKEDIGEIGAQNFLVEIGAWFNPARLHPVVESLVYWRDPKKSGAVFGAVMVTLVSLTCFSLISVVAYLGLLTLSATIAFRIYKNIMQAVQKTSDGHPFKEYLELELSLPEDRVVETSRLVAQHLNTALSALRSLFLVEDLVDSIKGLVVLWALTYVGALFNGLTLLIIGVVLVFSLPILYEKNQAQVDAHVQVAMEKLALVTNRVKAAIPSGKKEEKPKDQ